VNDDGSRVGPDLTSIGVQRTVAELERSLLDPDASVLPQHRFFRVVTRDGTTVVGRILNQDTFTVQLIDSHERLLSFSRSDLREFKALDRSPMPSYKGILSQGELADVITYLASLRGK
jgi:putative heme-binding domain-containing protein